MSKLIEQMPEDMTREEKELVVSFIDSGCPGLMRVQESDIFKWFDLYMSGKTYTEIATITKSKKDLVMYISFKSRWMDKRLNHYTDLSQNILNKAQQARIDSANTITTIIQALSKYLEKKYSNYLSNNDTDLLEKIDSKILTQYYKSIELLGKLIDGTGEGDDKPTNPMVTASMGASRTLDEKDAKKVDLEENKPGDLLKALAMIKKETGK